MQARPPPYSTLSMPVYSLATHRNMNIVTFAAPIAVHPSTFAIGLYVGTLSRHNMLHNQQGVLQILAEHHDQHFQLLGKTSGRDVDKMAALQAQGVELTEFGGQTILADCAGAMLLRIETGPFSAGDHDVVLCRVEDAWHPPTPQPPLYTSQLRQRGLLK